MGRLGCRTGFAKKISHTEHHHQHKNMQSDGINAPKLMMVLDAGAGRSDEASSHPRQKEADRVGAKTRLVLSRSVPLDNLPCRRRSALGRGVVARHIDAHLGMDHGVVRRLDGGAAQGARGVPAEPGVDALDVEPVAAPRQRARLLAALELGEADRAVPGADGRGDHGERAQHRGVEPPRRQRRRAALLVRAADVDGQAAAEAATLSHAPAPAAVVQVQRDEGQQDARKRPGRDEQDLAGRGVARRSVHHPTGVGLGHLWPRHRWNWARADDAAAGVLAAVVAVVRAHGHGPRYVE